MTMTQQATLLIELLTEELPPKALEKLANSFADTITDELKKLQFVAADIAANVYASPRRLAVQIPAVAAIPSTSTAIPTERHDSSRNPTAPETPTPAATHTMTTVLIADGASKPTMVVDHTAAAGTTSRRSRTDVTR